MKHSLNIRLCSFLLLAFLPSISFAQSSVLSNGIWVKIAISKTGIYKIDYTQLRTSGIDVDNINPKTVKVFTNPGGMLPQPNATPRPNDLLESAIIVEGESDGVFNSNDYVLFFAQSADVYRYNTTKQLFNYEHNVYANENYAFLTYGGLQGKRVQTAPSLTATNSVSQFQDVVHHELTKSNVLKSGREWFGERFENGVEQNIAIDIEGIVPGSTIKIVSDVVAYSLAGSSFALSFNGNAIAQQTISQVPNSQYGIKARHRRDTLSILADNVGATSRTIQNVSYKFTRTGSASSAYGHIDFFTVSTSRLLAVYGPQTFFRSALSLQQSTTNYEVDKANNATQVWDVTDLSNPLKHSVQLIGSKAHFVSNSETLREFVAFNQPLISTEVVKISNQNLHGLSAATLVIVTDDELSTEARRMANHRSNFSSMNVHVITSREIFNEFSGGRPDVTAIRDFARYFKNAYPNEFKYLLLFGKTTYDYKNITPGNINRVFTYSSRNSLSPLETYSSDDYFSFLETNEGEWRECFSCNETSDIAVGRIPAKHLTEATYFVDKLIDYETNISNKGSWQTNVAFVADDGDFNIHQSQADLLANYLEDETGSIFNAKKIYVDAYQQISRPAGQIAPDVNDAIKTVLEEGALVINYTGHGNEFQWTAEKILDQSTFIDTKNTKLPFLVTATCEFGRHDDPLVVSVAELALLQNQHGVVGLVTTARPVNSSTNFDLNNAFYEAFLQKENGQFKTIGEIFRLTKNNSTSGVSNRNFSLLADPSMHLAFPNPSIVIQSIETNEQTDTLRALSKVTVKGAVQNVNALTDESFNGTAEVAVYDKEAAYKTLGNENAPFNYLQWSSLLFKGQTKVVAGNFEFDFIVPKNIAYEMGYGRINVFAKSTNKVVAGKSAVKVGQTSKLIILDTQAPIIRAYMNDTTFTNGSIVAPDAKLVLRLSDESGINISNFGIGNDLIAVLDESITFELNEFYLADENDYTKGTVVFPLRDLSPGKHFIEVLAWDTHNKAARARVDFIVTGNELVIETFGNYPNPFTTETKLFFTHNRPGEDLETMLFIHNSQGTEVLRKEMGVNESTFMLDIAQLNRNDLGPGVYVAHLFVRSKSSGKEARANAKLIILN